MKIRRKLVWVVSLLTVMVFCCFGCSGGGNRIEAGTYYGSSGASSFVFNKDGTCTYEENSFGTYKYDGTWSKMDEENTYEIVLEGVNATLYGTVSDSGEILVTANTSAWSNETFSKE
ncbi:MAG: hypothetical protein NC124_13615 [Clostridium sp.]|nr:hypothetical protein [Clostridium sp.]